MTDERTQPADKGTGPEANDPPTTDAEAPGKDAAAPDPDAPAPTADDAADSDAVAHAAEATPDPDADPVAAADAADADAAAAPDAAADERVPEPEATPAAAAPVIADEPAPSDGPALDTAGAEPQAVTPEPPASAGDQIEWRPIVTGEKIEWQPVMSGEAEAAEAAAPESDDATAPDDDGPDENGPDDEGAVDDPGWDDALLADAASQVAGNGAGARGANGREGGHGAGAHPAQGTSRARRTTPPPRPPRRVAPPVAAGGDSGDGVPAKAKRQVVILSALTVAVVLVAILGFVLSRGATKKGAEATAPTTVAGRSGGTTVPPGQLATFRDDQTGFAMKYPKDWVRLNPPVSDIRLVLQTGDGDAVQVRILPITTPADQQNIGNFKAVTDAIVFGDQSNKLIQEQLVTLNGKLTYYYLYTFQDPATNQQGVHAHYFVFEGKRMFGVVFQSLPAEDFTKQAAVYDQVAESITVDPEKPGATTIAPTPTTTPPPAPTTTAG